MPKLKVLLGPHAGATFEVKDGAVIVAVRSADLQFEESSLSRHHAKLALSDGRWKIIDLGSSNGTFVNGVLVQTGTALNDGDEIRLGNLRCSSSRPRQARCFSEGMSPWSRRGNRRLFFKTSP